MAKEVEGISVSNNGYMSNHDGHIELYAEIDSVFSYALYQNHVAVIRTVMIRGIPN